MKVEQNPLRIMQKYFRISFIHNRLLRLRKIFALLLFFTLLAQVCTYCQCQPNSPTNTSVNPPPTSHPLPAIRWLQVNRGDICKGNSMIMDNSDTWLTKLNLDRTKHKIGIVNASNESIKTAGGALDGALAAWAKKISITPWTNPPPLLPDGSAAPSHLAAGQYALMKTVFGYLYLAVGARASKVNTLEKTAALLENLYYTLLIRAKQDKMEYIVLPAISTNLFAGDGVASENGQSFTQSEFVHYMYYGMQQGIERFRKEQTNPPYIKIILNNWKAEVVSDLPDV